MSDPAAVASAYFAAITAHDADAVQACFTDDAELVTAAGSYRGPQAIGDFYRQNAFQFEDLLPTPGPFLVDGDRLAVEIDLLMGGRRNPVADFFTMDGDRIRRLIIYMVPIPQPRASSGGSQVHDGRGDDEAQLLAERGEAGEQGE